MKKLPYLAAAFFLASSAMGWGAAMVTIEFDSGSQFLRDSLGALLSAGTTADGDGVVLQLGYYDGATTANNFLGNWVALSGQGSLNTGLIEGSTSGLTFNKTSIGDFSSDAAGNGTFALSLTFEVGNAFTGNSLPTSTNIPLSIRFFNSTSLGTATEFNVVSSDAWKWKTPAEVVPAQISMSLNDANLEWQGGAGSAFKTTLPVPEPSTGLALLGGVALLVAHRRRR